MCCCSPVRHRQHFLRMVGLEAALARAPTGRCRIDPHEPVEHRLDVVIFLRLQGIRSTSTRRGDRRGQAAAVLRDHGAADDAGDPLNLVMGIIHAFQSSRSLVMTNGGPPTPRSSICSTLPRRLPYSRWATARDGVGALPHRPGPHHGRVPLLGALGLLTKAGQGKMKVSTWPRRRAGYAAFPRLRLCRGAWAPCPCSYALLDACNVDQAPEECFSTAALVALEVRWQNYTKGSPSAVPAVVREHIFITS